MLPMLVAVLEQKKREREKERGKEREGEIVVTRCRKRKKENIKRIIWQMKHSFKDKTDRCIRL